MLWPDYAPERARHSLTQALYAARKASGISDVFVVSETIRLNFDCLGCDVLDFQESVRNGAFQKAVELYRGPFLDGFYLPSTEFENWMQHERLRLEDLAVLCYSRAIDELEEEQNPRAVEVARRLAAIRPTDASVARRLMRLLAAHGDRVAALAHAHTYSTLVREQHGLEPDAAVLAAAEEIRATRSESADATVPYVASEPLEPATAVQAPREMTTSLPTVRRRNRLRITSLSWRWLAAALVGTGMLAVALVALLRHGNEPAALSPQHRVVVAPFRVTAADSRLQYLSEGIVELLSTRLADDSTDRSVDAATMLRAWRNARITGARVIPTDSIVKIARDVGAERVITGSVVGTPDHVVLNASLLSTENSRQLSQAVIEGSTDTLTNLIDALARRLLLKEIAAQDELADRTTMSLPALRAYLNGSAAFARRDYMIAFREYRRALQLDDNFALAALKVGIVAGRIGEFDAQRSALNQAWRSRSDLSERDGAILTAFLGPDYPALSSIRASVAAWNRAARLAPDVAEVWYGLAAATNNSRAHALGGEEETVQAALYRALQLDSAFEPARVLLARSKREPYRLSAPKLKEAGPAALRTFALTAEMAGSLMPQTTETLEALEARASDAAEAMNLLIADHSAHVIAGELGAAFEVTRRMQRVSPATHAHLRLRVLDAIYAGADTTSAEAAAVQLRSLTSGVVDAPANACVLAQWHLYRGDIAGARTLLRIMKLQTYTPVSVGVHPAPCGVLFEAGSAVAAHEKRAARQLASIDSMDFSSVAAGDAATYAPLAIARWQNVLKERNAPERPTAAVPIYAWPRYSRTR